MHRRRCEDAASSRSGNLRFVTAGGHMAISAEYHDADKVLNSMRMISDKFHLAEISYPDGDEDGVVTVTNLCMLESGCDLPC
eukprot:5133584-Amphidinium_carterae.1